MTFSLVLSKEALTMCCFQQRLCCFQSWNLQWHLRTTTIGSCQPCVRLAPLRKLNVSTTWVSPVMVCTTPTPPPVLQSQMCQLSITFPCLLSLPQEKDLNIWRSTPRPVLNTSEGLPVDIQPSCLTKVLFSVLHCSSLRRALGRLGHNSLFTCC